MAQVSLPFTLTAGQNQNVNQLNSNLNALVTGVNRVESTQLAPTVQTVVYSAADQVITASSVPVTGVSLTVVPTVASTALVALTVTLSIIANSSSSGNAAASLYLDGVIQPPGIWVGCNIATQSMAVTSTVIVPMTLSAASHTITVQVQRDANVAATLASNAKSATRLTSLLLSQ